MIERDFLDKLYFGKIVPWENHNHQAPEMMVVSRRIDEALRRFYELLDDEGKDLLDHLMNDRSELETLSVCEAFKEGFRLGAGLTFDTFCGRDRR